MFAFSPLFNFSIDFRQSSSLTPSHQKTPFSKKNKKIRNVNILAREGGKEPLSLLPPRCRPLFSITSSGGPGVGSHFLPLKTDPHTVKNLGMGGFCFKKQLDGIFWDFDNAGGGERGMWGGG